MIKANIFNIQRFCVNDGPGIRTTVFIKGCGLDCAWCHNPESKSFEGQLMFSDALCITCKACETVCENGVHSFSEKGHLLDRNGCTLCGKCTFYCPVDARKVCGREYTVDEVFAEIIKDKAYYENSGGGVTFSGGECMLQIEFLVEILKKCKENGIHTAVDTAGYIPFESLEKILPYTDLFLYDIKCFDNEKHKKYVGVENELILENLKKLFQANAKIWIRIPVISDVNDSAEEMQSIKAFLSQNGKPEKIELLPYHLMGENKYAAIGRDVQRFIPPDNNKLKELKDIF